MSKALYVDCSSGIAGDMLVAALLDAGGDFQRLSDRLATLSMDGAKWTVQQVKKKGFAAQYFSVQYPPQHAHRHLHHIHDILDAADLGDTADRLARQLFMTLGQAEADVHGTDLKKVHFHEVGAIDSIVDIVAIAVLMEQLKIEAVYCSEVCTGFGRIEIDHGQVPVPAPATTRLLQGFPVYAGSEEGEMVTPTGAAFLAAFASPVTGLPAMRLSKTGVGAGTRDLEHRANVLRVYLGERNDEADPAGNIDPSSNLVSETLVEIACQVDDMTGQQLAALQDQIFRLKVNDCFLTSVVMKKGRPGTLITVHCSLDQSSRVQHHLLEHSTSLGVRTQRIERLVLPRQEITIESPWGPIRAKRIVRPDGQAQVRPEFDELLRLAEQHQVTTTEILSRLSSN